MKNSKVLKAILFISGLIGTGIGAVILEIIIGLMGTFAPLKYRERGPRQIPGT